MASHNNPYASSRSERGSSHMRNPYNRQHQQQNHGDHRQQPPPPPSGLHETGRSPASRTAAARSNSSSYGPSSSRMTTTYRFIEQLASQDSSTAPPTTNDVNEATRWLKRQQDSRNSSEHDGFRWTAELATSLGSMLARQLSVDVPDDDRSRGGSSSDCNFSSLKFSRETLTVALLELLVTAMDGWEDHIVYSVLMQESRNTDEDRQGDFITEKGLEHGKCKVRTYNLLTIVSRLATTRSDFGMKKQQNTFEDDFVGDDGLSAKKKKLNFDQGPIQRLSIMALALSWQSLERLDQTMELAITSPKNSAATRPWWIDDETAEMLAPVWLDLLEESFNKNNTNNNNNNDDDDRGGYRQNQDSASGIDQWRFATLTISWTLLYHGVITESSKGRLCEKSEEQLVDLISILLKSIQMLNHPVLPPSASEYTLPIALMSMSILSILKHELDPTNTTSTSSFGSVFHGFNQTIQTTRLVENVIKFSFPLPPMKSATANHTSRWIHPSTKRFANANFTRFFGLQLVVCWKHYDSLAWSVVMKLMSNMEMAATTFWQYVTSTEYEAEQLESQLLGALWLHRYFPRQSNRQLFTVLGRLVSNERTVESASALLFSHLFGLFGDDGVISYSSQMVLAQLLREMFSSRRSFSTQDELSDLIWDTMESSTINKLFLSVLGYVSTDDSNQPRLLSVLDLLAIMLENKETSYALMSTLDAGKLESFLYLIKPRELRYDYMKSSDASQCIDSETPPLNNLSRLDETSICFEIEETNDPRGIGHSVRLSAALAAANLACTSTARDEESYILVSRILSAVNDFVDGYQRTYDSGDDPTANTMSSSLRNLRLQRCITSPENELFLASMMTTSAVLRQRRAVEAYKHRTKLQLELEASCRREKDAREANAEAAWQLQEQRVIFQRDLNRMKVNSAQEAQQLVSLHANRRSEAEERTNTYRQELEKVKCELCEALTIQETLREAAERATSERNSEHQISEELRTANQVLHQEVQREREERSKIIDECSKLREHASTLERKQESLKSIVSERNNAISDAHSKIDVLHENLEDLFADMCSLAQVVEHNEARIVEEKELRMSTAKESEEKIAHEQNRNEELDGRVQKLQKDHDKLVRKLGKYKERLEQEIELKNRREEEDQRRKRNGPVSYINSLHTSTSSDRNSSREHRSQAHASNHSRSSRDLQKKTSSKRNHSSSRNWEYSKTEKENRGTNY